MFTCHFCFFVFWVSFSCRMGSVSSRISSWFSSPPPSWESPATFEILSYNVGSSVGDYVARVGFKSNTDLDGIASQAEYVHNEEKVREQLYLKADAFCMQEVYDLNRTLMKEFVDNPEKFVLFHHKTKRPDCVVVLPKFRFGPVFTNLSGLADHSWIMQQWQQRRNSLGKIFFLFPCTRVDAILPKPHVRMGMVSNGIVPM